MEMVMLKEFGFFAHVTPPHPFAFELVTQLGLDQQLLRLSWVLCNDSAMTGLCVRFKPAMIACGCIFLAARQLSRPLPLSPPWWRLVDGATQADLEVIAKTILTLRGLKKVEYVDLSRYQGSASDKQRSSERGRIRESSRDATRRRSRSHSRDNDRRVRRRDSRDYDRSRDRK